AVAIGAGLLSFLSPCVLPLVPAYLGQLTTVAVTAGSAPTPPSRWVALRHAGAYVLGFGAVFTLLGVTATFAGRPLFASIGILLIAYTLGLGIPFLALGLLYDRAPGLLRPLVRHGRAVSIVGGLLVIAIGVAMVTGWLGLLPQYFTFNSAI